MRCWSARRARLVLTDSTFSRDEITRHLGIPEGTLSGRHALVTEARRRGATACTLEVRVANHAAQGLYHQFGFAPVGIRKNYYAETGEDALIMWAEGLQTPAYAERLAGLAARIPEPREL